MLMCHGASRNCVKTTLHRTSLFRQQVKDKKGKEKKKAAATTT